MINIKQFDQHFRARLQEEIEEVEKHTLAEIVVIIRSHSEYYRDISLWAGFVLQLLVLGYLLFSPQVFNPYWICFAGVISFILGFLLVEFFRPLKRILIPQKRKQKAVEIYARALFQKGGICYTKENTGLLIFVSLLEKIVYLVPDKGLTIRIPEHVWQKLQNEFNDIFFADDLVSEALLSKLSYLKAILNQYVPPVENDINEIPDDLKIDL